MRFATAVVSLWACATSAPAQETTGDVRGRLRSTMGTAVDGATITATSANLLGTRRARSVADGVFEFRALPPGVYQVRTTRIGYRTVVLDSVLVQLGKTGWLEIELQATAVQLSEVRIAAPRVTLDPVRTTIGATLQAADLASIPAERDHKSLIAILPHVNTSYHGDPVNAGGSTGLENMYFIDGVNVTSPIRAASGTALPYNFIRAVEVKAGGYEAQFGRALGAVVNAVTYAGSNEHESSAFAFVSHSALAATPKVVPGLREVTSVNYDIGMRTSGPVMRNRLWYSAAYNPRVDDVGKEIPGFGIHSDRRMAQVFAGKLTWQVSDESNVEFSLFGDPAVQHQVARPGFAPFGATVVNPDPYLRRLETGGVTGSIRASGDINSRIRIDASAFAQSGRQSDLADTDIGRTESQFADEVTGSISGGQAIETEVVEGRRGTTLRGTFWLGRHTVIAGAEYEDARVWLRISTPGIGFISRTATSTFNVDSQSAAGAFHNRVPTAYLQDSWRIGERLTVNAGLRWSRQRLTGASGRTAQLFQDEWQPRAGFSLQGGRSARHRLFGSYGRYYQQQPLNLPSLWYVDYLWKYRTYSADPRQPGAPLVEDNDWTTLEKDVQRNVRDLESENFDEFTLGYERLLGAASRLTLRGIRRELRSSFQFGFSDDAPGGYVIGTPGEGYFSYLPPPRREYSALEMSVEGTWRQIVYRTSYVFSRSYGNYTGLYGSDRGSANPGGNSTFATPAQATNSTGLLPNDHTHVVKWTGVYRAPARLTTGISLTWASGTPLSEFGAAPPFGAGTPKFLSPRGTSGRTPSVFDVNVRLAYDIPIVPRSGRVVLDVFHLGNPGRAVRMDQYRYRAFDDTRAPIDNANYGKPIAYQPAAAVRLGIELGR